MTSCGQESTVPAPAAVTVSVYPPAASVLVSGTVQFVASGDGTSYTWSVNGTTGGDSTVGMISASGLYTAPSVPPSGSATVTATSAASGNPTGNALVTVTNPVPVVTSVSPATIFTGSNDTTITVLGNQFQPSSTVMVGNETLVTEYWGSTQLKAVVPAFLLADAAAHTITVVTPGPGGGLDNFQVLTVLSAGVVTATSHPLVAKYSISLPRDGQVTIEFGPDTSYGKRTWSRPAPAGGGQVDSLVAGMRQFSTYHMRAIVEFPEGTQFLDADHFFSTGGLPAARVPQITVTHPNPGPLNGGVELLDLLAGTTNQVLAAVTDLDGNLIWYYDFDAATLGAPFPFRPLPNGNILINLSAPGAGGLGTAGTLREIDLAGNTVWEITSDEVNTRLADAGFSLYIDAIHHDVITLPNGHLMLLVNSHRTFTDLIGLPGDTVVTGDALIDLDSDLNPVWVWDAFDYLDVNRHPFGLVGGDWTHGNALTYSPDDGNLLYSSRHESWVIKIDYQDGNGPGDILWRLGYEGDLTMLGGGPEAFAWGQHFPIFVSPNSTGVFDLALFDNGNDRILDSAGTVCGTTGNPPCYSRAPIFRIDEVNKTVQVLFDGRMPIYSLAVGSVSVFGNGNVEGDMGILFPTSARIVEMTQDAVPQIVWQMDITGQFVYRGYRIPILYPGVQW